MPVAPMPNATEMDRYYRILGLPFGAPKADVRRAYRDLARVWHPDRFPGDARLQEKAQENLRRINEAYARLKDYDPPEISIERDSFEGDIIGLGEVVPSTRGSEVVLESQEITDVEVDQAIDALVSPPVPDDPPAAAAPVRPAPERARRVDLSRPVPGHRVTGFDLVGLDGGSEEAGAFERRSRRPVMLVVALATAVVAAAIAALLAAG